MKVNLVIYFKYLGVKGTIIFEIIVKLPYIITFDRDVFYCFFCYLCIIY